MLGFMVAWSYISNVHGYRDRPPTQKHLITPHTHLQAYIIISSENQAGYTVTMQKIKKTRHNNMFISRI